MAEAHSAVAFSFTITHEGVNINYDREVLHLVWQSGIRSWRRRLTKFKNNVRNGVYPASSFSLLLFTAFITALYLGDIDLSFGLILFLRSYLPWNSVIPSISLITACVIYTFVMWLFSIFFLRYCIKLLFLYKGWMYESRSNQNVSAPTRLWLLLVKAIVRKKPQLYSFQSSLPHLPLPSLKDTMCRYLRSVKPLLDDDKYERMENLAEDFKNGIGKKLQLYLWMKSWWATNYVSDWWEEYVYLRGRAPLMINSNFYGIDAILVHPTHNQAARAANMIHAAFLFRRAIDRETLNPIMVQDIVPLCSWQYERAFNTTRIPGIETDKLIHLNDSQHVAIYHAGCYYKVPIYHMARLLQPAEIQVQIEKILQDENPPQPGEAFLGALTATDRVTWAKVRETYFSKGVNRVSLDAIEKAAFFVSLDEESYNFDCNDSSKLDKFGRAMLHGKGFDRWFDKSFCIIVAKNGRVGLNAEHSWADAPIMSHMYEFCLAHDFSINEYSEDGNTKGKVDCVPPSPIRLKWDISPQCTEIIDNCVISAKALIDDVDLRLLVHNAYGKGFMKSCKVSPDAYIQMALQLAYYRDAGKFNLTYEASMTRLFREGRTETVRPVTMDSCEWVKSMQDPSTSVELKKALLRKACDTHQKGYQDAMCGKGIDRHLFCLYVVSKYLEVDSPFLKEVLSEPWRLSTSQTPHGQTSLMDLRKNPHHISAGGGFGPVADDGYGVSYIIAGEDIVFFHVSSKVSSPETDSQRFSRHIERTLFDMRSLFQKKN